MSDAPESKYRTRRTGVRWDAKTIAAVTGLVSVLVQGGEARVATARVESKVDRLEERVARIEREIAPPPRVAHNDPADE